MQISQALKNAREALKGKTINPNLDAEIILAAHLGKSREYLVTHSNENFQEKEYFSLIKRRSDGEPVAYILGYQEFYGRLFSVTSDTLIPRPETEIIINHTLPELQEGDLVLDVGTGSGAIAITLQLENKKIQTHATDIDKSALITAQKNAKRLNSKTIFHHTDQFFPENIAFDIIVTNLPYIPNKNPNIQKSVARYEPDIALYGGLDGLGLYRNFFKKLKIQSWTPRFIICEMGYNQAKPLQEIIKKYFPDSSFQILTDHSGFDRDVIIRFN